MAGRRAKTLNHLVRFLPVDGAVPAGFGTLDSALDRLGQFAFADLAAGESEVPSDRAAVRTPGRDSSEIEFLLP